MRSRSSLRLPVRGVLFGSGICLWVACSSEPTDFFGTPAASGKSAQAGAGMASGGKGASAGDSGAGLAGKGSAARGGSDAGGSTGGTDPSAGSGNQVGGAPDAGAPNSGGKGGAGGKGSGGLGGSGLSTGSGGEAGDLGAAGVQSGDGGAPGGSAGEPGVGGTSGVGGSSGTGGGAGVSGSAGGGMGGSAGAGMGGAGGGTAGTGGQPPVTCGGDGECAANEYCKKSSCDAATGTCSVRPASCTGDDATLAPVCGCDKFTYYTACVAAREGVNVATSGECGTGSPCTRAGGSGDSCSPHRNRAACYRTRLSCAGMAPNEGVCWVLPDTCPQEDAAHLYCNAGGTPECHGLCEALESKFPLVMNSNQCK